MSVLVEFTCNVESTREEQKMYVRNILPIAYYRDGLPTVPDPCALKHAVF